MLTAVEYFKNIYEGIPKPIIVCDKDGQTVYRSVAAMPFTDQPLPKPLLREAAACIANECGSTLSLEWICRERVLYLTPMLYDGVCYAVIEVAAVTEYPELPALIPALTNVRGKISVYLDSVYFVAQQLGLSKGQGQELGYEVRRILRAQEHLDRLLDLTDRTPYRVPIDLNQFARAFAKAVRDIKAKDELRVEPAGKRLVARITPEDLELVLATLASNAFRFGADNVRLRTSVKGKKVRISLVDNGPGVEEPERLFECGYRTRDKLGGQGLGISLSMARHVLERQDATLQYERKGNETFFHIEMDAVHIPDHIRLTDWKPEDLNNTLAQLRVELSDYMIAMDFEENKK